MGAVKTGDRADLPLHGCGASTHLCSPAALRGSAPNREELYRREPGLALGRVVGRADAYTLGARHCTFVVQLSDPRGS